MTDSPAETILVAVSPSPSGRAALRRGVQEAQHRGARLHLVRVWRDLSGMPSTTPAELSAVRQQERAEQAILAEATATVQFVAPDLDVVFEFIPGDLYGALISAAADAQLLIVGAGRDEFDGGETARWFEEQAPCPVLVVDAPMPVPADSALAARPVAEATA